MSRLTTLLTAMIAVAALAGCRPGSTAPPATADSRLLWELAYDDVVAAPPVIGADGTIYVGSHDRRFGAVSPSGERGWVQTAGDFWHAPAAVGRDRIVVGAFDHLIYCFSLDGQELWRHRAHERIEGGAAIATDGTVYVPALDDRLYSFTPAGELRWTFVAADDLGGSPLLLADGSVVIGDKSKSGQVYRLDPAGGLVWSRSVGSPILSSPAAGPSGRLYVTRLNNQLVALDEAKGQVVWRHDTSGRIVSSPAVDGAGNVYVTDFSGDLRCVNPAGELVWTYRTYVRISSSPTLGAGGKVYFGCDNGAVYCVDAATGQVDWKQDVGGYISSSPVIAADGTLYIGTDNGKLVAVRTDSAGLDPTAAWPFQRGLPSGVGRR